MKYEYRQELQEAVDNYIKTCINNTSNITISAKERNALIKLENIVSKIRDPNNKVGLITRCSICGEFCDAKIAHLHQGKYIGDECCWDERLRSSE